MGISFDFEAGSMESEINTKRNKDVVRMDQESSYHESDSKTAIASDIIVNNEPNTIDSEISPDIQLVCYYLHFSFSAFNVQIIFFLLYRMKQSLLMNPKKVKLLIRMMIRMMVNSNMRRYHPMKN